jgi:hypothetical protein
MIMELIPSIGSLLMTNVNSRLISTRITLCFALLSLIIVAGVVFAPYVCASVTIKPIAPGITLTEEIDSDPPLIIHVLTVTPSAPGVHIEVIPGQDTLTGPSGDITQGRANVRDIGQRHGAVAAVNGDYFPYTGDPLGAAVWDGAIYSEPYAGRSVMGIGSDGRTIMFDTLGFLGELQNESGLLTSVTGIDRMVSRTDTSDLVVFTPTYGPRTGIRPGCVQVVLTGVNLPFRPSKLETGTVTSIITDGSSAAAIPADGVVLAALPNGQAAGYLTTNLHPGEKAEIVCSISPSPNLADAVKLASLPRNADDLPIERDPSAYSVAYKWATMREVVGGGPNLIVNGKVDIDAKQEGFEDSFITGLNPRTATGVTADGKLLLLTVDGRQQLSKGVSLAGLAKIMLRYGAVNAINLDGGGSTTMAVKGMVMNSIAATGLERPVADAICVFSTDFGQATSAPGQPTLVQFPPVSPILSITNIPNTIVVGQTVQLGITAGKSGIITRDRSVLWGGAAGAGVAYINQNGVLTALQAGEGVVNAIYNGTLVQAPIFVTSSLKSVPQSTLSGKLVDADPAIPLSQSLVIGAFTNTGMPCPSVKVHIVSSGGVLAASDVVTNIDGYAETKITWRNPDFGNVLLSSPGLRSKIISR